MSQPVQFVLLLDVDQQVNAEAVMQHVPHERDERHVLRLSDFSSSLQPGRARKDLDWAALTSCLSAMVDRIRSLWPNDRRVDVYVAGHAPLSLFFALGTQLDTRSARVMAIQQRRLEQGVWDVLELVPAAGPPVLEIGGVGQVSEGTGDVAIVMSTLSTELPKDAIRSAVKDHGGDVVGIASLAGDNVVLDVNNIGSTVRQIGELLIAVTTDYPHRTGATVFLAGPAFLALAAGLVLNPNQYLDDEMSLTLTDFGAGKYTPVMSLPLTVSRREATPPDADSLAAQDKAFGYIAMGIRELQRTLREEDVFMPVGFVGHPVGTERVRKNTWHLLEQLGVPESPHPTEPFVVNPLTRSLTIGRPLLHPIVDLAPEALERIGQLFALHELLHVDQDVQSHNYQGIGRSGVALEEIDFWADAFAIGNAALHHIRRNGPAAAERSAEIVTHYIDAHLAAMRAFDVMEQGTTSLLVMPERRLRRYLIWHLQRARAVAVKEPAHIEALMDARVVVELAPLRGRLDHRHDKIAESALQSTTLTLVVGGLGRRLPELPNNFAPSALVDAVRHFDEARIEQLMGYVVNTARDILVPWET